MAASQEQFLNVIDRDEAERRFLNVVQPAVLEAELVPLAAALHRTLAQDVPAPIDVPGFDRANVDGFAVRAADTFGATEDHAICLRLNKESLATGVLPQERVAAGTASVIATGGVMPRGADAVVMIEHTDTRAGKVWIRRPVAPGANVTFAGTDIGKGEVVVRRGELLTSRETGVLASLGLAAVSVVRRPRVAILSTGDELVAPGSPIKTGMIYDSNATILAHAVVEEGGVPIGLGIVPDNADRLRERLQYALDCDVVLLSGGTSKGTGDVSYQVVADLGEPGIIVHGVALKPGKPLCLAAVGRKPVIVLPGFPTSAIFTFREFVAPILRKLAGRSETHAPRVKARLPFRVNSEPGRTEYLLVGLVQTPTQGDVQSADRQEPSEFAAYPMGKGSGSVTAFSKADGFITIPKHREYLEEGEVVEVQPLGIGIQPVDLVIIGSHCTGLDWLVGQLQQEGIRSKVVAVGSQGGLSAARRGECDIAGIHLVDPKTGTYNTPFLGTDLELIRGYGRMQGIAFRLGDRRFEGLSVDEALANALADPDCVLVNRNRGSGTRLLIDGLLGSARPSGYAVEARSHNAVAASIAQGRADWGVCIATVAQSAGLAFLPLQEEQFDFVTPKSRADRQPVRFFRRLLNNPAVRAALAKMGFAV